MDDDLPIYSRRGRLQGRPKNRAEMVPCHTRLGLC